ncbi:unnamed protein product [Tuber melanosporum]|uniref:(Perigord truffle) hypothetical protein n=1 Tax=Tuber melanosporum (strain Mel28) TaxID=656061 RepID=D5GN01_TUBMM|nr:uncharacterized protein GSTUM_00010994001 [Tuber melanosporum]CAZ85876.1 unnamed protein product [Tuber melanosporum]
MEDVYCKESIQEGSASAARDNKSLVFFVAGENCWRSMKWENENLLDGEIFPLLKYSSIVFKLKAGSAEAGFLAMFCPVEQAPYLVVVKNVSLVTKLTSDTPDSAFTQSLKSALSPTASPPPPSPPSTSVSTQGSSQNTLSSLFADRRVRLEQQQKALTAAAREKKAAEVKRRQNNLTPDRKKYVEEQTRRIAEEKAEKERILLALQHDRIEREVRELRKRQGRAAVFGTPVQAIDRTEEDKVAFNEVLVSVRLLNGRLIKARFLEGKGLAELRHWVDENRTDGAEAYTFMQPPDRKFSALDENKSLKELKFPKLMNLVLVRRWS